MASERGEGFEKEKKASQEGWGWGNQPQHRGFFPGPQTPPRNFGDIYAQNLRPQRQGSVSRSQWNRNQIDKEELFEQQMREKRRQNNDISDVDWFENFLTERIKGGAILSSEEQDALLLLDLIQQGANLDTSEMDELKIMVRDARQQQEGIVELKSNKNEPEENQESSEIKDEKDPIDIQSSEMTNDSATDDSKSRFSQELRKQGFPSLVEVSLGQDPDHHSVISIGVDSYIDDLKHQKEDRENERTQQAMDDALELYEKLIEETNQRENEQLFSKIYRQVLEDYKERYKEQDRIADERLRHEIQMREELRIQEEEMESVDLSHEPVEEELPQLAYNTDESSSTEGQVESPLGRIQKEGDSKSVDDQRLLDEMNDLFDRLESGEDIDENRIYELDLEYRIRQGEELTSGERDDYNYFLNKRKLMVDKSEEATEERQSNQSIKIVGSMSEVSASDIPSENTKLLSTVPVTKPVLSEPASSNVSTARSKKRQLEEKFSRMKAVSPPAAIQREAPPGPSLAFEHSGRVEATEDEVHLKIEAQAKAEEEAMLRAEEDAHIAAKEEATAEEEARMAAEANARAEEEIMLMAEEQAHIAAEEAEARSVAGVKIKAEKETMLRAEEQSRVPVEGNDMAEKEAIFVAEAKAKALEERRLRAKEEAQIVTEEIAKVEAKAEGESRLRTEDEALLIEEGKAKAEEEPRLRSEEQNQITAKESSLSDVSSSELDVEAEFERLLDQFREGKPIDEYRLCELELNVITQTGHELSDVEKYELDLLNLQADGSELTEDEEEDLDYFIERRLMEKKLQFNLETMRASIRVGQNVDPELLFEFELFEKRRLRKPLNELESIAIELMERNRMGEVLEDSEMDELLDAFEALRNDGSLHSRETLAPDIVTKYKDTNLISKPKSRKEALEMLSDDKEFILGISEKLQRGQELDEDELYELEIFERQRRGKMLTERELEHKMLMKKIRVDHASDEPELAQLRTKKAKGELVDENLLYELELFQEKAQGKLLTKEQLFEIRCFERRRAGVDLDEKDLDELDQLKRQRLRANTTYVEQWEQDDDSVHMHRLLEKKEKEGVLQDNDEYVLQLIQRQNNGEVLQEQEMEALQSNRLERHQHKESLQTEILRAKSDNPGSISEQNLSREREYSQPSLLQGMFGKRRKARALEEMKRKQEALIKEQMQAMQLHTEFKQLEQSQIEQEELVRSTIEKRESNNPETVSPNIDDPSIRSETAKASSKDMSTSLHDTKSEEKGNISEKMQSPSKTTDRIQRSSQADSVKIPQTSSIEQEKTKDEVSVMASPSETPEAIQTQSTKQELVFEKKSSKTLSAHITSEDKDGKKKNRFGDEISVGINEQKKGVSNGTDDKFKPIPFGTESEKEERPWDSTMENSGIQRLRTRELGSIIEEDKDMDDQNFFERSFFNFESKLEAMLKKKLERSGQVEDADLGDDDEEKGNLSNLIEEQDEQSTESEQEPEELEVDSNGSKDRSKEGTAKLEGKEASTDTSSKEEEHSMDSIAKLGVDNLNGDIFEGIKSKLDEKMKSDEAKFNEAWEREKADRATIARIDQIRKEREQERVKGKEEDTEEIQRLFLFEGERLRRKKKNKKQKSTKRLETKLSKDFRKAMDKIFESESDDDYDIMLGEGEKGSKEEASMVSSRRLSNDLSLFDDLSGSSQSNLPEAFAEKEAQKGDGFSEKVSNNLRDKSMKQEGSSIASTSQPDNLDSLAKNRSVKNFELDPADIYAKELEKTKERKKFSVAELRKEMEELKGNLSKNLNNPPIQANSTRNLANDFDSRTTPARTKSFEIGGTLAATQPFTENDEAPFLASGDGGAFGSNASNKKSKRFGGRFPVPLPVPEATEDEIPKKKKKMKLKKLAGKASKAISVSKLKSIKFGKRNTHQALPDGLDDSFGLFK